MELTMNLGIFGEGAAAGVSSADAGQSTTAVNGQVAAAETAERDYDAEFDRLITGEYKDAFKKRSDAKTQDAIQRRFKSTNETVEKYEKAKPMFELLAKKYGVKDAGDIDALFKAMDEDSSYLEQEAMERGVTVEQMREIRTLERKNKELNDELARKQNEENAKKQYAKWYAQAEDAKKLFPGFNIDNELQNERFRGLLLAGVDVTTAFKVLHQDEIVPQVMKITAEKTAEKTANAVRANGMRPVENGSRSQAASAITQDISKLTKEQRMQLIMRAERGEKITLK